MASSEVLVLSGLIFIRILCAYFMPISDCDETFNYWEPLHFDLYGSGLQTWEYSPSFGLRSWLYVLLHKIFALPAFTFGLSKPVVWFSVRACLGVGCSIAEFVFFKGVEARYGRRVASIALLISATSSGMAISSIAFLPSSFVMMCHFWAMGSWLSARHDNKTKRQVLLVSYLNMTVASVVLGCVVGWPFGAFCMLPCALDVVVLMFSYRVWRVLFWTIASLVVSSAAVAAVDTWYYCVPVFSTLNIFMYNVRGGEGRGSHLYGVEPVSYFFKNLTLNFNIMFPLALVAPLLMLIWGRRLGWKVLDILYTTPFHFWFLFWALIPHKEERFMFPAYPTLILSAALSVHAITQAISRKLGLLLLWVFIMLSCSRTYGLQSWYSAPVLLQHKLYDNIKYIEPALFQIQEQNMAAAEHVLPGSTAARRGGQNVFTICYGKEWYRYPSAFFLPLETRRAVYRFAFIRSGFRGQLPAHFTSTCEDGGTFNDLNQESMDRYVDPTECDLLFDSEMMGQKEPSYLVDLDRWTSLKIVPILDPSHSPWWSRSFYIPRISERYNVMGKYYLVRRAKRGNHDTPPPTATM
eukprot:PhF_6_TR25268/c0_g1_i1/m.34817/K03846/ALG9; alpha-1,2-mannosyltransferase